MEPSTKKQEPVDPVILYPKWWTKSKIIVFNLACTVLWIVGFVLQYKGLLEIDPRVAILLGVVQAQGTNILRRWFSGKPLVPIGTIIHPEIDLDDGK